jgi:hypothetical protein
MIFRNYTPFPHLVFESRDEKRRDFGVLVLRGTFEILENQSIKPAPNQEPIVMADQYRGEPGRSSLRMENNLAPYKPKSDVHLDAVAHAPNGQPRTAWRVGVEVGKVKKELAVTGPRYWHKTLTGWILSDAIPTTEVPIQYESAYGGIRHKGKEVVPHATNPIGSGVVDSAALADSKPIQAPNNLPIEDTTPEMNLEMKVEGLGPLAPAWQPRLQYAGTFDTMWERTRWPDLPEDFKFDFYNSAHPDLIYPGFLQGNEPIRLKNLTPSGDLSFSLPDYQLGMLYRFEDGQLSLAPMQLDTLHLDVPKMRAFLVWRGLYPLGKPLRVLEARMRLNASKIPPQSAPKT